MNVKGGRSGNEETRWEAGIAALMRDDTSQDVSSVSELEGKCMDSRSVLEIESTELAGEREIRSEQREGICNDYLISA